MLYCIKESVYRVIAARNDANGLRECTEVDVRASIRNACYDVRRVAKLVNPIQPQVHSLTGIDLKGEGQGLAIKKV